MSDDGTDEVTESVNVMDEATKTIRAQRETIARLERDNTCPCGHIAAEHYGEGASCMGDAVGDETGTIYCACTRFSVNLKP